MRPNRIFYSRFQKIFVYFCYKISFFLYLNRCQNCASGIQRDNSHLRPREHSAAPTPKLKIQVTMFEYLRKPIKHAEASSINPSILEHSIKHFCQHNKRIDFVIAGKKHQNRVKSSLKSQWDLVSESYYTVLHYFF